MCFPWPLIILAHRLNKCPLKTSFDSPHSPYAPHVPHFHVLLQDPSLSLPPHNRQGVHCNRRKHRHWLRDGQTISIARRSSHHCLPQQTQSEGGDTDDGCIDREGAVSAHFFGQIKHSEILCCRIFKQVWQIGRHRLQRRHQFQWRSRQRCVCCQFYGPLLFVLIVDGCIEKIRQFRITKSCHNIVVCYACGHSNIKFNACAMGRQYSFLLSKQIGAAHDGQLHKQTRIQQCGRHCSESRCSEFIDLARFIQFGTNGFVTVVLNVIPRRTTKCFCNDFSWHCWTARRIHICHTLCSLFSLLFEE